ncbi:MAG TPA: beta-propeller fold lactonase family protein, partial [Chloroflexia bacterium]|nr:beta-propeller fold lactonase family protein [Chloroflexia bacterium]
LSLTGPNAGEFTPGAFDQTINDGDGSATLSITCTPTGFGLRTATLAFTTNDPTLLNASYNLVCEGVPPPPAPLAAPGSSTINGQGPNNLGGAYDVALSPDGLNAYVTSFNDDSLSVFRRDAVTGALTFVMDTVIHSDMDGPGMVRVSPDGTQVYVTAFTADSFLVFPRNPATGIVGSADVWTQGDAGITGLNYPYGIAVSPDGRFIYVTSFLSDAVVRFYRDSDGFVGFDDELIDHTHLDRAYLAAISPDGKNLYVTGGHDSGDTTAGYISVFGRDGLDGSLTYLQQRHDGDSCGFFCILPLSGAWGVDVSPDGQNVYVAGHYDDDVVVFSRAFSGTLSYRSRVIDTAALEAPEDPEAPEVPDTVAAIGLNGVTDVEVSPDGLFVYAAGTNDDAVVVFGRNPDLGSLTSVQNIPANGNSPALDGARMLEVSTDGTTLYATGSNSDSVVAFHAANPVASLSTLLPASAAAGSPALTVRVQGEHFVPGSVVRVNGADRETKYIHPQELEVKLLAADLAAAGSRTITVFNPGPGGGVSLNNKSFAVTAPADNPVPSIDELSPGGATGGDAVLTLTISGANFLASSTVKWNGVARSKTFINSGQLQINVSAQDMQSPGTAVVTLHNPAPGGGQSNSVGFDVAGPNENPVPSLTSITPEFTRAYGAGSLPVKVRVQGTNFLPGIQGQWNGLDRPTLMINSTTVEITLIGTEVAFGGAGAVTVVNPGPGGGPSNALPFIIFPYSLFVPGVFR